MYFLKIVLSFKWNSTKIFNQIWTDSWVGFVQLPYMYKILAEIPGFAPEYAVIAVLSVPVRSVPAQSPIPSPRDPQPHMTPPPPEDPAATQTSSALLSHPPLSWRGANVFPFFPPPSSFFSAYCKRERWTCRNSLSAPSAAARPGRPGPGRPGKRTLENGNRTLWSTNRWTLENGNRTYLLPLEY